MDRNKRTLSALICLGFVLLLALTQVWSIHVLHHHPVGESCAVCHQVRENQNRLSHTAAQGGSGVELLRPCMAQRTVQTGGKQEGIAITLISLKVKLSN